MTLLWQPSKTTLSTNIFVVTEHNKFHFNGATLNTDSGCWEKNDYRFDSYFALFPNTGIGIYKKHGYGHFGFLSNGKVEATVSIPDSVLFADTDKFFEFVSQNPDQFKMREEVAQWFIASNQTCQYLLERWRDMRYQDVRIHIAEEMWMIQNHTLLQICLGAGKKVWGVVSMEEQHLGALRSARVSPLENGWLIEMSGENRGVLIAEEGGVGVYPLMFPFENWEETGSWRYWPMSGNVLTPRGRMIVTPVSLQSFLPEGSSEHLIVFQSETQVFGVGESDLGVFYVLPAKSC